MKRIYIYINPLYNHYTSGKDVHVVPFANIEIAVFNVSPKESRTSCLLYTISGRSTGGPNWVLRSVRYSDPCLVFFFCYSAFFCILYSLHISPGPSSCSYRRPLFIMSILVATRHIAGHKNDLVFAAVDVGYPTPGTTRPDGLRRSDAYLSTPSTKTLWPPYCSRRVTQRATQTVHPAVTQDNPNHIYTHTPTHNVYIYT